MGLNTIFLFRIINEERIVRFYSDKQAFDWFDIANLVKIRNRREKNTTTQHINIAKMATVQSTSVQIMCISDIYIRWITGDFATKRCSICLAQVHLRIVAVVFITPDSRKS